MKIESPKILRVYTNSFGKSPFVEWINHLKDSATRARVRRRLDRLEQGHYGDNKSLGNGVFELRLQFGAGYRIYFGEMDEFIIILLTGGNKSTQTKDIKLAKRYWHELKGRKDE